MLSNYKKSIAWSGLFVLASFDFFLLGLQGISKAVSKNVSWITFGFFVMIIIIQLAILYAVSRFSKNEYLKAGTAGLFLAGNILTFYLSFFEKVLSFHKVQLLIMALVLSAISAAILFYASRSARLLKVLLLILIINSLYTFISILKYNPDSGTKVPKAVLTNYQNIKFKSKPNIHFIGFDSLSPEAVVTKHMGLKNLPYVSYMKDQSYILSNLFASAIPSINSFNSIMRLADSNLSGKGFFTGRTESPVADILHNNGYRIENGYEDDDFFGASGPYVDEYATPHSTNSLIGSTLCNYSNPKEKILQYYGLCYIYPKIFKDKSSKKYWHQDVTNLISQKAHSDTPWMTINYTYHPIGHTPVSINSHDQQQKEDYYKKYADKSSELTGLLQNMVSTVRKEDPNSIVFIFGDHGPYLSRTMTSSEDTNFFVTDRYAVFGALLKTNNPCSATDIKHYYTRGYSTLERTLAGIFRCLAEDPKAVDNAVHFQEAYPYYKFLYDK